MNITISRPLAALLLAVLLGGLLAECEYPPETTTDQPQENLVVHPGH